MPDPASIMTAIGIAMKGIEAGELLVKVIAGLIDALAKASKLSREQCLDAIRVELAATRKAQDEAEAREIAVITGGSGPSGSP